MKPNIERNHERNFVQRLLPGVCQDISGTENTQNDNNEP